MRGNPGFSTKRWWQGLAERTSFGDVDDSERGGHVALAKAVRENLQLVLRRETCTVAVVPTKARSRRLFRGCQHLPTATVGVRSGL